MALVTIQVSHMVTTRPTTFLKSLRGDVCSVGGNTQWKGYQVDTNVYVLLVKHLPLNC